MDALTGQRQSFLAFPSSVESISFSPDGKSLAVINRVPGTEVLASGDLAGETVSNPVITIIDLATGKARYERNLAGGDCGKYAAWDLTFTPDGNTLVFRDYYSQIGHNRSDNVCLLSSGDGTLLRALPIELPWRTASQAIVTPDGKQLLIGLIETSTEGSSFITTRVRFYETSTGTLLHEIDGQGAIHSIALSPDGATLALADQSGARLISTQNGSLLSHVGAHTREVFSVGFSPDGTKLALGSLDSTLSLWSVADGRQLWQSAGWRSYSWLNTEEVIGEIWDVAFSSDGANVFGLAPTHQDRTGGRFHALRVSDGQEAFHVDGYNTISHPAISPDQSQVAFGGYEDGQVQVWSVVENKPLFNLLGHTGFVTSLAYAPDGKQLASASLDGTVRIWNSENGSPIRTLTGHSGPVRVVQFSPDGTQLASLGDDSTLRLWDTRDGQLRKMLDTQSGNRLSNSITYTLDGQRVLLTYGCPYYQACQMDAAGDLRQVDLTTGQVTALIPYGVFTVSFSNDQAVFALDGAQQRQSGQRNGEQYLTQGFYRSPIGNGVMQGAAISSDGQLFFSGNAFGLHVWDVKSGEMIALCKGLRLPYGEIQVTPDQKLIIIASPDGLVSLWGIPLAP
ncbi:WD40 repeat domain-containing protein [Anaerolinea sp.]|uniref:WD40 repeat domain-containing protein n=1 Tax=Anaerolinea sp. TaxID=1872519 RepID=UPI002ACEDA0C|nr:WD40 repeat domain-containing protein [Anaerolinea sp.]